MPRDAYSFLQLFSTLVVLSASYYNVCVDAATRSCYVFPSRSRAASVTFTSYHNWLRTAETKESYKRLPNHLRRASSLRNFILGPDGESPTTEAPPNAREMKVDDRSPYEVLKVKEKATPLEIKTRYRKLSRKYHPDTSMRGGILPGSCDSEEEVREEWFRIKDSYEILSDRKERLKYDRKTALEDSAAAMGKAAMSTLGWGIAGLGVGLFKAGEMAVKSLNEIKTEGMESQTNRAPPGVPTIEEWTIMRDGGVRGNVYGHPDPAIDDGDIVSTSWIETGRKTGDLRLCNGCILVETGSGSKYFLGAPSAAMAKKMRLLKS